MLVFVGVRAVAADVFHVAVPDVVRLGTENDDSRGLAVLGGQNALRYGPEEKLDDVTAPFERPLWAATAEHLRYDTINLSMILARRAH